MSNRIDLTFDEVTKVYRTGGQTRSAVDGISFTVPVGEPFRLGVVGESGSGKSTLGLMALGLLRPTNGSITLGGVEIEEAVRGEGRKRVQALLQNPFAAFNPFYSVLVSLRVALKSYRPRATAASLDDEIGENLALVDLRMDDVRGRRPREMSGGQLQRAMLARAMALGPEVLVADEPTSMLDVNLRWKALDHIINAVEERNMSLIYITHDILSIQSICDEIMVLEAGRVVDQGRADHIMSANASAYTQELVAAVPAWDGAPSWNLKSKGR